MPRLRDYLQNQSRASPHSKSTIIETNENIENKNDPQQDSLLPSERTKKLQDAYAKRVREHGPRVYRWPDGTLQQQLPPPNPYAIANRARWAPLIHYCRTHGGDRTYDASKQSFRYGINVSHEQHVAYLKCADLQPEVDQDGKYTGFDDALQKELKNMKIWGDTGIIIDPLKDPAHAFNTFYKEQAKAVFENPECRRGRLL